MLNDSDHEYVKRTEKNGKIQATLTKAGIKNLNSVLSTIRPGMEASHIISNLDPVFQLELNLVAKDIELHHHRPNYNENMALWEAGKTRGVIVQFKDVGLGSYNEKKNSEHKDEIYVKPIQKNGKIQATLTEAGVENLNSVLSTIRPGVEESYIISKLDPEFQKQLNLVAEYIKRNYHRPNYDENMALGEARKTPGVIEQLNGVQFGNHNGIKYPGLKEPRRNGPNRKY